MSSLQVLLLLVTFNVSLAQICPGDTVSIRRVPCQNDQICLNYDQTGFCYRGSCCTAPGFGIGQCGVRQFKSNGFCHSLATYLQRCELREQCSFSGGICQSGICRCNPGFVFTNNQCDIDSSLIPPPVNPCNPNQVLMNGNCYSISGVNGPCLYDQQCQEPGRQQLFCQQGFCQFRSNGSPTCQKPGMVPEYVGGAVKNCLREYCSDGYRCEYDRTFNGGQYICCGSTSGSLFGRIKMYPQTNLPLQCFSVNSCTFIDYPHCVFSPRYGHNVCCSKKNCY